MKTFFLAIGILLGSLPSVLAQNNALKINLFSPLLRTLSVFCEHKLSTTSSGQLGVYYTGWKDGGSRISGVGITPEYRYYLSDGKEAIEGFYVAPFLRFQYLTLTEDTFYGYYNYQGGNYPNPQYKATLNTAGLGLLIGHQWVFRKRVALDTFIGPGYNVGKVKVSSGYAQDFPLTGLEGFTLRVGVALGIAY